ncbi:MAG TPA: carbon-nitrogen hydrolase family protein [Arachidicoccus sp.]|nr:carbon-nitrogen hydrolase family protein [Arachidicoccus sp.]
MKIAIASPTYPESLTDGLIQVERMLKEAAAKGAAIICFPESYIPGYPGVEFQPEKCTAEKLEWALDRVCQMATENSIAVVLPMDWYESGRLLNIAYVISRTGEPLGYQTKNQLDPTEDLFWLPGTERQLFDIDGLKFGITICHEGFRYPESVRWAATRGAQLVFHPNCTGSNIQGPHLVEWGHKNNPYYEKAQMLRAMENGIFVAGVNYTFNYPDSTSAIVDPDGNCICSQPYREAGVSMAEIDPGKANGIYAKRFKPDNYYSK